MIASTGSARTAGRLITALATLALASGCFTLRTQVPGALRADLDDEQVIVDGRFDVEVSRLYLFWGLVPVGTEDELAIAMREAAEARGGDGLANLVFEARFTPLDLALQVVTLGVVAPRTYRVRGDVVRIQAPPLPGEPLLEDARHRREQRRDHAAPPPAGAAP